MIKLNSSISKIMNRNIYFFILFFIFVSTFLFGMMDEKKIIPSNNQSGDHFGWSVAINDSKMIVGAPNTSTSSHTHSGSAYIFSLNSDGKWEEEAVLYPNEPSSYDHFGYDVALDNNVAIISAIGDGTKGPFAGAVYVYRYSNNNWVEEQKLIASNTMASDRFGCSIDIINNVIIIGAYQAGNEGKAYIFRYYSPFWDVSLWSEESTLIGMDLHSNDHFGYSVSITEDETAFVGAHLHDGNGFNSGAVYVFNKSGVDWSQTQKLTPSNATQNDLFGYSISSYSNRVLIGSYYSTGVENNTGAAYIFTNNNSSWSQESILTASDGNTNDYFGVSVLLGDGKALIGSSRKKVASMYDVGSTYLFVEDDQKIWNQIEIINSSNNSAYEYYGLAVGMNEKNIIVGSRLNDSNGTDAGALFTYKTLYSVPEHIEYTSDSGQSNGNIIIHDILKINNYSGENLNWSLSKTVNWIDIQDFEGELPLHSSVDIDMVISSVGLSNNIYSDTLTITFPGSDYNDMHVPVIFDLQSLDIYSDKALPEKFSIDQIYPNPFNPITTIKFGLPINSEISIAIYDLQGRKIVDLLNTYLFTGYYSIKWNAMNYSSGVYLVQMKSGSYLDNQKLMLVK